MALIHITGKSYELIIENRSGWNVEAFRNRYSEVLERYDYIVGDWGYNQLRLKGFFRDGHQKATKDSTFSYATDYINEYCNFGCAYFVLEKKIDVSTERNEEDIYIDELEIITDEPTNNEEKSVTVSSTGTEGKSSNQEHRRKPSHKSNDTGVEKYFEKSSEKSKQRNGNRQNLKVHAEDNSGAKTEGKKESRPDGKQKRKEHYYRKGNRSQDKKVKANKSQSEQLSTVSE
ncbi:MAG: YutD family protein [Candidatus Pristimantibacillus lignocellulolyticus]|uniref:YutD family protein n=1 Tax=Candidatus Pristimantibacillus lignocellulolyticus TaxID=2994561 RepID=A0A9J6Z931_9BACL|nr:MAG: YutD family protein [Candidatus Pristimantibacillus lignocellulolyticus]